MTNPQISITAAIEIKEKKREEKEWPYYCVHYGALKR